MATKNPDAALEALTRPAKTTVGRFEMREPTLGMMAILEKIGSPFAVRGAKRDFSAFVETLFALTRPAVESLRLLEKGRDAFKDAAFEWSDTVSAAEGADLRRAATAGIGRFNDSNPAPYNEDDSPEDPEAPSDPDPTADGPTDGSSGA